jgi:hypothetical protein
LIVEARYASGAGVLVGSGAHWVLLTDPGDERVVQDIWDALVLTAPSGASVAERVLAIAEKAFEGDPPGLALVDFTSGASTTLSRGLGHVRLAGPARVLSLDAGADPESLTSTRRLVGGVVAADRVELMPVSARTAPAHRAQETAPPAAAALIDGIPDAILAAKGPDGPPPRTRVRRPVEDTGSLVDTSEPDPLMMQRIEEGAHTTITTARRRCDRRTSPTARPRQCSPSAARSVTSHPRSRRSAGCATSGSPRRSLVGWTGHRWAVCGCPPARSSPSTGA